MNSELKVILDAIHKRRKEVGTNLFIDTDVSTTDSKLKQLMDEGYLLKLDKVYRCSRYPGTGRFHQQWGLIDRR